MTHSCIDVCSSTVKELHGLHVPTQHSKVHWGVAYWEGRGREGREGDREWRRMNLCMHYRQSLSYSHFETCKLYESMLLPLLSTMTLLCSCKHFFALMYLISHSYTTPLLPRPGPQLAATPTCHIEHAEFWVCTRPLHGVLLLRGAEEHLHHVHRPVGGEGRGRECVV